MASRRSWANKAVWESRTNKGLYNHHGINQYHITHHQLLPLGLGSGVEFKGFTNIMETLKA